MGAHLGEARHLGTAQRGSGGNAQCTGGALHRHACAASGDANRIDFHAALAADMPHPGRTVQEAKREPRFSTPTAPDRAERAAPRAGGSRHDGLGDESGFTLIELVVVIAVLPVVVGAMVAGLLSIMSITPTISNKLSDSGDAEVLSASFTKDVQGASMVTAAAASTSPAACGKGTQLLGLQYPNGQWISYSLVTSGAGPTAVQNLYRNTCQTSGGVPSVISSAIVSHDVVNTSGTGPPAAIVTCVPTTPPTPTPASCAGTAPNFSVADRLGLHRSGVDHCASPDVRGQQLPADHDRLTVGGRELGQSEHPQHAPPITAASPPPTPGPTPPRCASSISPAGTRRTPGRRPVGPTATRSPTASSGTPFTISFCLTTTGGPIVAAAIPTYTDPGSSAFLGNNGFYTGIPGNPALYQNQEGTNSTVTITNIKVTGAGGVAATNWNLITGDAESTDAGESVSWTAGWAGSNIPTNQQVFTLVDNTPGVSAIGNACANPTAGSGLTVGNGLTGVGSNSVTCAASVSSVKTGTVMISAPAPTSLTSFMVGTGLEGIFMGILLPS